MFNNTFTSSIRTQSLSDYRDGGQQQGNALVTISGFAVALIALAGLVTFLF